MGYDDMEYNKCIDCPFIEILFKVAGGICLVCKVTGKTLEINHCTHYYGAGRKRND